MRHAETVWLHGMVRAVVVSANFRIVIVAYSILRDHRTWTCRMLVQLLHFKPAADVQLYSISSRELSGNDACIDFDCTLLPCAFSSKVQNWERFICSRFRESLYVWRVMNGQIYQYIVYFSSIKSLHPICYRVFSPCENSWKTWCFKVAWFEAKWTTWPLCRDENARKRRQQTRFECLA